GGKRAHISGAQQAYSKPDLAACRSRQELTQRNDVGKRGFIDPFAPSDKFLTEIANMRDWATKRGKPQPEKRKKHLKPARPPGFARDAALDLHRPSFPPAE